MLQQITPTLNNFLQLCQAANKQYAAFIENPPQNELDIIDWRVNHIPLDEFVFPEEYQNHAEVILFKGNFEKSVDYFYQLMGIRDSNNHTERVSIALTIVPGINPKFVVLTAVSPKEVSSIDSISINNALLDKEYESFYIDSPKVRIDLNDLSVPAISVFIGENREPLFETTTEVVIKGQLVVNSKKQFDVIEELHKPGVRVEVERVR